MARYIAAVQLPARQHRGGGGDELSAVLAQALLALDLELEHATRRQVVAAATPGGRWPASLRLLVSWRPAESDAEVVELNLELLSRESMVTGAPASRAALEQLVAGLIEQLPGLRQARQASGGAPVQAGVQRS